MSPFIPWMFCQGVRYLVLFHTIKITILVSMFNLEISRLGNGSRTILMKFDIQVFGSEKSMKLGLFSGTARFLSFPSNTRSHR